MKQVKGWWFGSLDGKLGYGDDRKIVIGETHEVQGDIIPCKNGLHLSKRLIDALKYVPGPVVHKVVGHGVVVPDGNPVDKFACSKRTYVAKFDASDMLHKFARLCALDVIHMWDAPDVVVNYLKTGDPRLRDAAQGAAQGAARDVARYAAWGAARGAARSRQNKRLTAMIMRRIKLNEKNT